jgi:hypothetical protein
VYRGNPLEALSRRALDAIFTRSLRCGARTWAETWSDVGVDVLQALGGV